MSEAALAKTGGYSAQELHSLRWRSLARTARSEDSASQAAANDWIPSIMPPSCLLNEALRARENATNHEQVLAP